MSIRSSCASFGRITAAHCRMIHQSRLLCTSANTSEREFSNAHASENAKFSAAECGQCQERKIDVTRRATTDSRPPFGVRVTGFLRAPLARQPLAVMVLALSD